MIPQQHLVIMAKAARIGRVKTRLAQDIGRLAAWSFYRHTLFHVSRPLAADRRWQTWLCITPDTAVNNGCTWPANTHRIGQGGGGLGDRMDRVMKTMRPGPVVIIGADIPDIRPCHIKKAFKTLGDHDTVFGPAEDGGYWLVGQRRRPRILSLFADVRWSSPHALADTLKNIPDTARTGYLEELADVDDGPSYRAFIERYKSP